MSKAIELTHETFQTQVLESDIPALVDFWAPWCGPCQMLIPILDEVSEIMGGKVKICKLNTDEPEHMEISGKYGIQSIPNMKLFKDGEVIANFLGVKPKDVLIAEIEKALA